MLYRSIVKSVHIPTRTHFLPSITFQSEAIMTNTRWTINGSGSFFITAKTACGPMDVHMRSHTKILDLIPCCRGFLEKLKVAHSDKKLPIFMELHSSLPCSQKFVTGCYPEQVESSGHPPTPLLEYKL